MSFVRIQAPSGSSPTREESKTCLGESCQHTRREALRHFCREMVPKDFAHVASAVWVRVLSTRPKSWCGVSEWWFLRCASSQASLCARTFTWLALVRFLKSDHYSKALSRWDAFIEGTNCSTWRVMATCVPHSKTLRVGPLKSEAQGLGLSTIIVCCIWSVSVLRANGSSMVSRPYRCEVLRVASWGFARCKVRSSHSHEQWCGRGGMW